MVCKDCGELVRIEHIVDSGTVIIHCPKCTGECLTCGCPLQKACFGDAKEVRIVQGPVHGPG